MEKITVVKIGGNVIDDPAVLKRFIADFAAMPAAAPTRAPWTW